MTTKGVTKVIYFDKADKMITLQFAEPTNLDKETFERIHGKIFMTFVG